MTQDHDVEAGLHEAHGLLQAGRAAEAAHALRRLAERAPEDPRVDLLLAGVAGRRHDHAGVLEAIDRAMTKGLQLPPQIVFARIHALYTLGRIESALAAIDATPAPPASPLGHNLLGLKVKCLERDGDPDEVAGLLDTLQKAEGPSPRLERMRANLERRRGRMDAAIARLRALLERPDPAPADRIGAGFDLARLLDRDGRHAEAFEVATTTNAIHPRSYDPAAAAAAVTDAIERGTPARLAARARASVDSERPVFIVGMPRSGTSLLEQIVASHPDASGVGERQDPFVIREDLALDLGTGPAEVVEVAATSELDAAARRYLRMLDTVQAVGTRVTNKALSLDGVVDFLAQVLPGARFIWIHRDPRDAIVSAWLHQIEKPWAWSLEDLAHAHVLHGRLRDHWTDVLSDRSLEVRYEDLVAAPDAEIDRVISWLGLPADERCRRFHESSRSVLTPSHEQVRRPINRDGIERWRHHEAGLAPALEVLGRGFPG